MQEQMLNRIVVDAEVLDGQPHIRDTRFTVSDILYQLAQGLTMDELLGYFPVLTELDIRAALAYAAIMLDTGTESRDHSPLL